jgi:hypothetical protein
MFPHWFKRVSPKKSRPAPRRRRPARVQLGIEALEERAVPTVSAVVSGGELVVSTNASTDTVSIDHKLATSGPVTFVNGRSFADSRITRDIHIQSGFETVNILATAKAVNFDGEASFVNVGKAGSMQGITAPVSLGADFGVTLDDSADPTGQNVGMTIAGGGLVQVSGLARFQTISFKESSGIFGTDLKFVNIAGGTGANTFNIFNTPNEFLIPGGDFHTQTFLALGTGNDTVNVHATSSDKLFISGLAGGTDRINIGDNHSLQGIQGEVDINDFPAVNGKSNIILSVDGSADNQLNPAGIFMGQLVSTTPSLFSIVGMTPADRLIQYDAASTSVVQVRGEKATRVVIFDTDPNANTEVDTGSSASSIQVQVVATHGTLTLNSLGSPTEIDIGAQGTRSLQNIQGAIQIFNSPNFATVNIDESADNRNHSFVFRTETNIGGTLGVIDGEGFVAPIFYNPPDIHSITLTGGQGSEGYLVESTVGGFPITINAPGTSAEFIVGFFFGSLDNIHNPLTLNGGAGFDTLLVADQNAATGHFYSDNHFSQITRDFGAVTVNYSLMNTEQLIQSTKPPTFIPDPGFPQATDLALTDSIRAGQRATLTGRLVDADPREVLTLTVNWGDGSAPVQSTPDRAPFHLRHRYDAPGTYKVSVVWTDSVGRSNFQDLTITVGPARHGEHNGDDGDDGRPDHSDQDAGVVNRLDAFFRQYGDGNHHDQKDAAAWLTAAR